MESGLEVALASFDLRQIAVAQALHVDIFDAG